MLRRGAAAIALLLLAGCSSPSAPGTSLGVPTASASAAPSLTSQEEEIYGPRVELPGGLLLKQLGKVALYGPDQDNIQMNWHVRMVVDKIAVDPACDRYVPKSERGHRLVISLRAETSAKFSNGADMVPQYYAFSTVDPDGVSEASPSSMVSCHEAVALPIEFRPSAKYRGEVTVDTGNPKGQLVLANTFAWDYGKA
jgi:hypothetical protein